MKYISLLFTFALCTVLQAQNFPYWGKVSDEDLQMTVYENDTAAAAVILVNYGKARFDIYKDAPYFIYDYHYQIKILKKGAFDEADIKLSFSRNLPIENLEATTYNWENGKMVAIPVSEITEKKISKYRREKVFAFTNVKVGSILEYKFSIAKTQLVAPREFYFQKHYPVKFSEYHFAFPTDYDYQLITPALDFYEKGDSSYILYHEGFRPIGVAEYWWKTKNVAALKDEPYVNYIWAYRHRMKMQLARYRIAGTTTEKEFLSTWQKLAKNYREDDDAGKLYANSKKIKLLLQYTDVFMTDSLSDKDKIVKLFDFVREHVEWTEDYSLYADGTFKQIYNDGEGSGAEINLMLLTFLKHYGIEANPVLIATQDYGYAIKSYPFAGQFNHVIIAVEIEGEMLFLDATDLTYPYDVLPLNSYTSDGFWIGEITEKWVEITSRRSNEVAIIDMEITDDGQIKGKISHRCQSYSANKIRKKIARVGEEKYKKTYFEALISNFTIDSIKFENLYDNTQPFMEEISFVINDAVQINGDFMYFNPMLDFGENENPFKAEERHLPIELPYLFSEQCVINIKIPEGYTVDELPKNTAIKLDENKSGFTYMAKTDADKIQVVSKINISNRYFDVSAYPIIQNFYTFLIEKQSENIVLRKIN